MNLAKRREVTLEICYEGGDEALFELWFGNGAAYRAQHGRDLGTRMNAAFIDAFLGGDQRVILIGTDLRG